MQAHITSGVFMDVAVLKVSHSVGIDKDATALQAASAWSSSIGAMKKSLGRFHKVSRQGIF